MPPASSIKSRNQYAPISEVSKRSTVRNHGKRRNENLRAGLVNGCETAQAARRFNVCVSPGKPGRKHRPPHRHRRHRQRGKGYPGHAPANRCAQHGFRVVALHAEWEEAAQFCLRSRKRTLYILNGCHSLQNAPQSPIFCRTDIGAAERTRTWANLTRIASVLGLDQAGFDAVLRETAERCQRYQAAELVRQACARF